MKKRFLFGLVAVPILGVCLLAVQGCTKKENTEQGQAPEVKMEDSTAASTEANAEAPVAVTPEAKTP